MKFLCIGYFDAKKMGGHPKHEIDALMARCHPHLDELYASGQAICDIGVSDGGKYLRRVNANLTITEAESMIEASRQERKEKIMNDRDFTTTISVDQNHGGLYVRNTPEVFCRTLSI